MASGPAPTHDKIDRVAPTHRPDGRVVMRQNWHDLLFLHWAVPVEQIRPLIPRHLEIDTFEGQAFVGLVPFTMTGVRPTWSPALPFLSNFHETNVRTYVHFRGANPGVWFFSLDAANAIAVRIAQTIWKLPYHYARMRLDRPATGSPSGIRTGDTGSGMLAGYIDYTTERLWPGPLPGVCSVQYTPIGPIATAPPGSLEHFLVERYILYTGDADKIFCGRVNHPSYQIQQVVVHALSESLVAAAGITRGAEEPLAHYSREVRVNIFPLSTVRV